jgi:hypothetical protein
MFRGNRRSAMKVRDGRVQWKNRRATTPHYLTHEMPSLVIDRKSPGRGYKHLVSKEDVRRFVELLPNWQELQQGLNAIVLDRGGDDCLGWHRPGVVAICAWDREIEFHRCYPDFIKNNRELCDKLSISYDCDEGSSIFFTEPSARAFLLIHVLVHELGHHHDRMTTRSQRQTARGEQYAEAYARRFEDQIIARYRKAFAF